MVLAMYTLDQLCRRLHPALRMICCLAGVDIDGSEGRRTEDDRRKGAGRRTKDG